MKRVKFLLTELHIQALFTYNKTRGWMVWALCILMSWCYLLRVQSESLTVFKGRMVMTLQSPQTDRMVCISKTKSKGFFAFG